MHNHIRVGTVFFSLIDSFFVQKYPERVIHRVLHYMIRRGEIQHRMQRKMLYRIK